jgi:hypothetical protein
MRSDVASTKHINLKHEIGLQKRGLPDREVAPMWEHRNGYNRATANNECSSNRVPKKNSTEIHSIRSATAHTTTGVGLTF